MYHVVCVAKYRRLVISEEVDEVLRDVCVGISQRYEIRFLEIGADGDHMHFLVQSVPMYRPTKIATTLKSVTGREVFKQVPEIKKQLWGGEFNVVLGNTPLLAAGLFIVNGQNAFVLNL